MPSGSERRRPPRRGFEVAGPKGRAYTEAGHEELLSRSRDIISRNLHPERHELLLARRALSGFVRERGGRREAGGKSFRRLELERRVEDAELLFNKKFLRFVTTFLGVLPLRSATLRRVQQLLVLREKESLSVIEKLFMNIARSKRFGEEWRFLKNGLGENEEFSRTFNSFSFAKKALSRALNEGVNVSNNLPRRVPASGEVPKRLVVSYIGSVLNIFGAMRSVVAKQKELARLMQKAAKNSGLSRAFVDRLGAVAQRLNEVGAEIMLETNFWESQKKLASR